jgi:hypothetical protein
MASDGSAPGGTMRRKDASATGSGGGSACERLAASADHWIERLTDEVSANVAGLRRAGEDRSEWSVWRVQSSGAYRA